MGRFTLNRRTVLRGMLGGAAIAVALPPLEAMFDVNGTAYAGGETIPKRFGVFFWGNGVKKDRWNPSGTGADYPLSPALEPLAAVKEYVSVVSGMDIKTGNERGHQHRPQPQFRAREDRVFHTTALPAEFNEVRHHHHPVEDGHTEQGDEANSR